jgi:hypothetical protein
MQYIYNALRSQRCSDSRQKFKGEKQKTKKAGMAIQVFNTAPNKVSGASLSPPSSLTHVHRCIGSRNSTRQTLPTSAKLMYLCVYDSRDGVSGHGTSPDKFPVVPLLSHVCTQVYRFSQHNPTDAAYLCETDVSKCL